MRFQMGFLRVVESFQQGAFVDGRAGIAHIRDMHPDGANFLDEIRTMLITPTGFAVQSVTVLPCALIPTQCRRFDSAVCPILARIEGKTRLAGSNFYRILPDFPGDGGWILMQFGSYFLKGHSFL